MRRVEKFVQSHGPYAVDLSSLRVQGRYAEVDAVWFRRRRGTLVACIGHLWDHQDPPTTVAEFLARHDDGRHGGTTAARWDGSGYWSNGASLLLQEAHLVILRPMLENYPAVPPGYDGWYTFRKEGR
jgi:hypothetical protein